MKALKIKKTIDLLNKKLKSKKFKEKIKEEIDDILLLKDMLKAQYNGSFKFKKKTISLIVFALLYLVNPFDLIPDFLITGFLDDFTVIGYVVKEIKEDIERYKKSLNS